MSCAYDLAYYVANTLSKGTLGVNVYCNLLFEDPDNQIAIAEYGGRPADMAMGGTADPDALEYPSVQVCVRNLNAQTAYETAYSIYKSLDGLGSVTINGNTYDYMKALQPPFIEDRDTSGRATVRFNLWVTRRRSAT